MEEDRLALQKLIRPLRRRLLFFRWLRWCLIGLSLGSGAAAFVLAASRLWPLPYAKLIACALLVTGLLAAFIAAVRRGVSLREAARVIDKGEAEDAVLTAMDNMREERACSEEEARMLLWQRQDAIRAVERFVANLPQRVPWPAWSTWRLGVYSVSALYMLLLVLFLLPNPMDERATAMLALRERAAQLEEELDELIAEVDEETLPDEMEAELLQPLEELRSQLQDMNAEGKLEEELREAIEELEQLRSEAETAVKRLEAAAESMRDEPQLSDLGQALQDRDMTGMQRAIEALRSELHALEPAEREALAQALERLAAEQPLQEGADDALSSALPAAAQQARAAGSGGAATGEAAPGSGADDGLAALEQALAHGMSQGELERLARSVSGQLSRSGGQVPAAGESPPPGQSGGGDGVAPGNDGSMQPGAGDGGVSRDGDGAGAEGVSESGNGAGAGTGAGTGNGAESGTDAGSGNGTGAGTGTGTGNGAGADTGAGTGTGTGSGGASSGGGAGTSSGSRTMVTTPRTMAGEGEDHSDGGPSSGGDISNSGPSIGNEGVSRPYEEVFGEYARQARESLSHSSLPSSMQEKIKRYFEAIQPE
ncbi:hypothetical protein M6D81_00655 [Paenibacillus sp. J5C_2022]|uniref:hypothetical protein n=1 Tax=Paenibacillus sp. J5C2022 TaxID=2977129 RepID=UPI0021CE7C87|nr:hypothetical protein [Paenibacillus sp. J5C2022]MCU6707202.1 hypothetical protein [Paenibacillus sp. J5C2022]